VKTASKKAFFVVAVLVLAFAIAMVLARLGPAQSVPMEGKTAEEVYKNVQVLKGIPADQIIPAMQFMSASLGVECEHCHVEHAFDKDDKKPKQTARKMMQMMFAINKDNFKGHREVTCYSCHHGAADPVGTPLVADAETMPESHGATKPEAAKPAAMPPADQIVDKYVQALGGAEALGKISSRVEKGNLTGFGDRQFPIEVYAKAPDKRLSVMHMPNGESITAYDGRSGWLGFSHGPPHPMTPPEANSARMDADFLFALRLKQNFSQLRVERPEKIGDQETYLVVGENPGQPPVSLYFSQESALLVRLVRYVETPLGRNPTQIDYADYREVDGIKVPFRWTLARPGGRFTIQVDQCQQNVPIDDTKFSMLPAPAPAAHPTSP
jgi:photosynthetic reaction center cytochrome c subunit